MFWLPQIELFRDLKKQLTEEEEAWIRMQVFAVRSSRRGVAAAPVHCVSEKRRLISDLLVA